MVPVRFNSSPFSARVSKTLVTVAHNLSLLPGCQRVANGDETERHRPRPRRLTVCPVHPAVAPTGKGAVDFAEFMRMMSKNGTSTAAEVKETYTLFNPSGRYDHVASSCGGECEGVRVCVAVGYRSRDDCNGMAPRQPRAIPRPHAPRVCVCVCVCVSPQTLTIRSPSRRLETTAARSRQKSSRRSWDAWGSRSPTRRSQK